MCTLKLPKLVIDNINSARKQCLWRGFEVNSNRKYLAAWDKVCKPKLKGGLGVLNPSIQNQALLLKYLEKFYNRRELPWIKLIWNSYYRNGVPPMSIFKGSFWWRDIYNLMDFFRGVTRCLVGDGVSCSFWNDVWSDDPPLSVSIPRQYLFAVNTMISVHNFLNLELEDNFHLPLSQQAFEEYQSLSQMLEEVNIS